MQKSQTEEPIPRLLIIIVVTLIILIVLLAIYPFLPFINPRLAQLFLPAEAFTFFVVEVTTNVIGIVVGYYIGKRKNAPLDYDKFSEAIAKAVAKALVEDRRARGEIG